MLQDREGALELYQKGGSQPCKALSKMKCCPGAERSVALTCQETSSPTPTPWAHRGLGGAQVDEVKDVDQEFLEVVTVTGSDSCCISGLFRT